MTIFTFYFFHFKGTAFINAVFYGSKQDTGNESEAGCSSVKDVSACASIGSLQTRKHVLQVSTYQVFSIPESKFVILLNLSSPRCAF